MFETARLNSFVFLYLSLDAEKALKASLQTSVPAVAVNSI